MKKLVIFLNSLPVHKDLKISPEARVKRIVTLLLNAAQSGSNRQTKEPLKKKTKNVKDDQAKTIVNQPEASLVCFSLLNSAELEAAPESSTIQDELEPSPPMCEHKEELPKEKNPIIESDLSLHEATTASLKEENSTKVNTTQQESTTADENSKVTYNEPADKTNCAVPAQNRLDTVMPIFPENAKPPVRHTDLRELQKMLRNRFPVPWNVTTTEKYLLSKLLLLLKSNRPRKSSVWKITFLKPSTLSEEESEAATAESESSTDRDISTSSKSSKTSKTTCDNAESFKSAQSEAKFGNTSGSDQDGSFFSCKTPQDDSLDTEPSIAKEDPFDRLKQLNVNKSVESELTLSDVELMEEMEITLRRLEKENEGESSDKSDDLLDDPLPCPSNLLVTLPQSISAYEHNKLDRTVKSVKVADKSSTIPSAAERRRSPRLAGLPALPLIFTQQPLPGKRKCSSPPSSSTTPRSTNNSERKSELHQTETFDEESPSEPTPKRPRYSASETPNLNLTPYLPKKPMRRRIVSPDPDPYKFVASDEELVIEEPKPQTDGQSKKKSLIKSDSSSQQHSPDVVELPPYSERDVEAVYSQVKAKEQTKEDAKNKSLDVMPITPESETGSCRAGSSLYFNSIPDEKSNDSVQEIAVVNTNITSGDRILIGTPLLKKIAWEEIRKLLPTCWAAILEKHVKFHHPEELLLCKEPDGITSNIPTVYCCTEPDS